MSRAQLFAAFFFTVFLYLLYQFYLIFQPFVGPLSWAALLALMFYPVQQRLTRAFGDRAGWAALLLTTFVIVVVIAPTFYFTALIAGESVAAYQRVRTIIESGEVPDIIARARASGLGRLWDTVMSQLRNWNIDLAALLLRAANLVSAFLMAQAPAAAANVLRLILNFFFASFALFFFFRDGERMVRGLRDLLPMEREHKDVILLRFYDTLYAVLLGSLVTAAAQGFLAGIGFWALGVPFAVLLGGAAGFLSLLPVGAPVVWFSVVVYLFISGAALKAVILFAYGTVIIGSADNFIRPLIVGGRTQIPTVFLFFGMLGGLQAYGLLGMFLGPALIAILVAFVRIYREEYAT